MFSYGRRNKIDVDLGRLDHARAVAARVLLCAAVVLTLAIVGAVFALL